MEFIPEEWKVTVHSERPKGMSVPEPNTWVRFEYLHGNIVIEYGEEKSQVKNKDLVISLIELL